MTDEKLNECSPETHGIYIKGIMCLMHKSDEYGKILLKQKYKQTESTGLNFGYQLTKHLPYSPEQIQNAIDELIRERVCFYNGDYLCQKRMIHDNLISEARSNAAKKGGGNPNFVKTKLQTNTENEYEVVNEVAIEVKNEITKRFLPPTIDQVIEYCNERQNNVDPVKWVDFYSSKGWMIGKNKMKDWKAAVRTWEKNKIESNGTGNQKQQFGNISNSGVSDAYKQSILNRLHNTGS
ncbi:MAG: hypothetical protein PHT07_21050 [Paludibacter sp.]|nr:hypothetical protein [Paludibacter sp.]